MHCNVTHVLMPCCCCALITRPQHHSNYTTSYPEASLSLCFFDSRSVISPRLISDSQVIRQLPDICEVRFAEEKSHSSAEFQTQIICLPNIRVSASGETALLTLGHATQGDRTVRGQTSGCTRSTLHIPRQHVLEHKRNLQYQFFERSGEADIGKREGGMLEQALDDTNKLVS